MSQMSFGFPHDVTRYYEAGGLIYMFKFKGGSCLRGQMETESFARELEEIVRTVLGNLQNLQPFSSTHFNIFPYQERWHGASQVSCHNAHNNLKAYPFVLILHLEENKAYVKQTGHERGRGKEDAADASELTRHDRIGTLEDAVLQDMMNDSVVERRDAEMGWRNDTPHTSETDEKNSSDLVTEEDSMSENNQTPAFGCIPEEAVDSSEEEEIEEDQNHEGPGFWNRLLQNIFPFSLFQRDT
ncbi:membrane-anchored junction protein isoform X1 [Synchiropus splendidus]|uniref:membrane-anchored junction protein isoform X1 n=1 Tax=Synchiropus splendidus TaxID=270530 RepID=UPI00237D66F8|nr:membrane-anchored junction protein isoform X1 [Synchiropus splendidus]XP_053715983.1 membrane-anchored junction protein isoform X1 [Synchiropus splendidus]